jgi:peroxiredoxin
MTRRPLLIAFGLAAPAALCAGALLAWRRPVGPHVAAGAVDYFFTLNLDDADGVRHALASWRGKQLIVNFWATWCAPCVEEMPLLQALADQMQSSNVAVVGIAVDEPDNIRQFRREHGIRFDLLAAGFEGMELAQRLGNPDPVLPYTVLISADGRVMGQYSGRVDPAALQRKLSVQRKD